MGHTVSRLQKGGGTMSQRNLFKAIAVVLLAAYPTSSSAFFMSPMPVSQAQQQEQQQDQQQEKQSETPKEETGDCSEAKVRGEVDAGNMHSSKKWFWGGVGSGILLGLIGTGVITIFGAVSKPTPKVIPEGLDESCYEDGYKSKGKSKNTWAALGGGVVGTVIIVGIIVAASDE